MPETRRIQYISFGAANLPGGKPQVSFSLCRCYRLPMIRRSSAATPSSTARFSFIRLEWL